MGVGDDSRKVNWRISSINADYAVRLEPSHMGILELILSVLPHISCPSACAFLDIRQHA
jgi:hypothetical protein